MSELPPPYPLILNPRAKSEKGRRALKFIMAYATRFIIHATRSREEAIALARQFAADGEPLVIAAGGDGTLNAVIEGLAGSATVLGVFPTGTMNVFAREMGIPYDRLANALEVIDGGHHKEVDLFAMNGAPFVQMAGVGFDAQVIEETSWQRKKRLGPLAYVLTAIKVLRAEPPVLEVDGGDGRDRRGVALLVGNGVLYGGQFPFFKNARNDDGLLDVILFKEPGWQIVKDCLVGLIKGGIDANWVGDSVECFQAERLTVTAREEVPVEVDGEWWGRSRKMTFQSSGRKLRVLAPAQSRVKRRSAFRRIFRPGRS